MRVFALLNSIFLMSLSFNLAADTGGVLNVAAAADLTEVFQAIEKSFEEETGIKLEFTFDATGELAKKIESGAGFDVFAAADTGTVQSLAKKGFIEPGSVNIYARGRLVAWWEDASIDLADFDDLLGDGVQHVAIANPDEAPFGLAANQSLMALHLWQSLQAKIVQGENVANTRRLVENGQAEVAFIALSLVQPGKDHFLIVPESLHAPINQAIGMIKETSNPAQARKFLDFVLGEQGQLLLQEFFYIVPVGP